jgi:serine/threonine protein kinase
VAIKVLPDIFTNDPDRVARFQREAEMLASLNHPNIAAIYGLEESVGTNFLVLELVEGQYCAIRHWLQAWLHQFQWSHLSGARFPPFAAEPE